MVLSAASLTVSWLAFYRVQMRGPRIILRPPVTRATELQTATNNLLPSFQVQFRLLIVNEGPRAGVLEAFADEPLIYRWIGPRVPSRYQLIMLGGLGDERGGIQYPVPVNDGEIKRAWFHLHYGPLTTHVSLNQVAKDLRGLDAVAVEFPYLVSTKRGVRQRWGVVRWDFVAAKEQIASQWFDQRRAVPEAERAVAILRGEDPAADIDIE